jgi:hypothetical protein
LFSGLFGVDGMTEAERQAEILRLIEENGLWLYLSPPNTQPEVERARICSDEETPGDVPPSWDMVKAIYEMIGEGSTVWLVTKHQRHFAWVAAVASQTEVEHRESGSD